MALHKDSDLSMHRLLYMIWLEDMELVHIPAQCALVPGPELVTQGIHLSLWQTSMT
jgi:hypothetical protein